MTQAKRLRRSLVKRVDPCYIPMMENIRELVKNTIFAHPEDVAAMVKASTPEKAKKKKGA